MLNKLNLLASLNLLEKVCLHEAVAERRHRQSAAWRNTVQEVEASLGLNTEHKA
jgi:hypothetical protein